MRVPVVNGHSEAVNVETRVAAVARARRASCCAAAPGVTVLDDPGAGRYPLAIEADGQRRRLRRPHPPRPAATTSALDLWIVSDNLRKGAATNAVQLAEVLHERGLIGARVA